MSPTKRHAERQKQGRKLVVDVVQQAQGSRRRDLSTHMVPAVL